MQVNSTNTGSRLLYGPDRLLQPRAPLRPGSDNDAGEARREAATKLSIPRNTAANDMAAQERQVLAREQALKAAGGKATTTYTYAIGPDGKSYIVGAEVSIVATEDVLDAIPGGGMRRNAGTQVGIKPAAEADSQSSAAAADPNADVIAELEQTEREVIAHEAAHQAAAGRFGGPVQYTYTTGPDGKRYISGGSVQISTPATSDPEEALRNAQQVMRAAMAPGDPSGQDIAVAANAVQTAASAQAKIAAGDAERGKDNAPESTGLSWKSLKPAKMAEKPAAPEQAHSEPAGHDAASRKAADAYASNVSPKGLWTESNGYENAPGPASLLEPYALEQEARRGEEFNIAA